MKRILVVLILTLAFSCSKSKTKKESEKTIFNQVVERIESLDCFKNFEMNSGTVLNYEKIEWKYASTVLQSENKRVVTFEEIIKSGISENKFQILDTIHINNLSEKEFISVGICENNGKSDSRIIALIERPENDYDLEKFTKIKKAWRANFETKKIEEIKNKKEIECINESYGI